MDTAAVDPTVAMESKELARLRVIDELIDRGDSDIQQFYNGAVVLVTGGSGFLGKQLIEKLFRACNIKTLYMLMRSKKGKSVQERLESFLKDPVFEKVRRIKPDFGTKIVPVFGDITEIGLGISEQDRTTLTNEVSVILHGAATISFVEPLKLATITNVRGAREMLALAKRCTQLKSYVHISTAYTHATYSNINKYVDEKFYDSPVSPTALIELAESTDEDRLNDITQAFIKNWPNTYTFTKAAAEELVRTMGAHMPVCVVRPAIVVSALREPHPGWLDPSCVIGPSGLVMGAGLGAIHAVHVDLKTHLDIVAVDLVNNAVIAAAKETHENRQSGADIKIYTVTGGSNSVQFGDVIGNMEANRQYTNQAFATYFVLYTRFKLLFWPIHLTMHLIPAYLADFILRLLGKRPKAVRLCKLFTTFTAIYEYYLHNEWHFGDDNLQKLYNTMSAVDRTIFDCNMNNVDWKIYAVLWCIGIKRYLLKEDITTNAEGKKRNRWLWLAVAIILPTYFYILYQILFGTVSVVFMVGKIFYLI